MKTSESCQNFILENFTLKNEILIEIFSLYIKKTPFEALNALASLGG